MRTDVVPRAEACRHRLWRPSGLDGTNLDSIDPPISLPRQTVARRRAPVCSIDQASGASVVGTVADLSVTAVVLMHRSISRSRNSNVVNHPGRQIKDEFGVAMRCIFQLS